MPHEPTSILPPTLSSQFEVRGSWGSTTITSKENLRTLHVGAFERPNVTELRKLLIAAKAKAAGFGVPDAVPAAGSDDEREDDVGDERPSGRVDPFELRGMSSPSGPRIALGGLTFGHVSRDVRALIRDPANADAVFQVASQFNCLEMVGPSVRPEDGITGYAGDPTQGPACAIVCAAATLYRNYFVNGGRGQRKPYQLNLLADVEGIVGNDRHKYWTVKNGYCLPTAEGKIASLGERLLREGCDGEGAATSGSSMTAGASDIIRGAGAGSGSGAAGEAASTPSAPLLRDGGALATRVHDALRVGIHWSTSVFRHEHNVCQVFCSALPVAYVSNTSSLEWEPFAQVILDAAYDATLLAGAVLAHAQGKRVTVFLTALGGGAFGNRQHWIRAAVEKAIRKHREEPIDVKMVHYGGVPAFYEKISLK